MNNRCELIAHHRAAPVRFTSEIADNDRNTLCNRKHRIPHRCPLLRPSLPIFFPVLIHIRAWSIKSLPGHRESWCVYTYIQKREIARTDRMRKQRNGRDRKEEPKLFHDAEGNEKRNAMHPLSHASASYARAHRYSRDTAAEEIVGTVIACYLSHSDACNLSSTILVRTHVRYPAGYCYKMIHYDICNTMPISAKFNIARCLLGGKSKWCIYEIYRYAKLFVIHFWYIAATLLLQFNFHNMFFCWKFVVPLLNIVVF